MKKLPRVTMLLLTLALLAPRLAQAGPLGLAGEYNVFVFGNIEQWGTDVEGRVAAGGNVTFGRDGAGQGFAIASTVQNENNLASLVAGHNVTLRNGSVGYLEPNNTGSAISQKGTIVYGGVADIPVGVGFKNPAILNPGYINFANEQSYLEKLSADWGSLAPTGANIGTFGNIDLAGNQPTLNIFSLAAADIKTDLRFDFHVPAGSAILVNVAGAEADLVGFGFYFNGIEGEGVDAQGQPTHPAGYPYSHIVFNFLDATHLDINDIAINGSILAPFAHVDFGEDSHVDGNLIALSLFGQGESHIRLFAVPEPATLLLLLGGLVGLGARRRRI